MLRFWLQDLQAILVLLFLSSWSPLSHTHILFLSLSLFFSLSLSLSFSLSLSLSLSPAIYLPPSLSNTLSLSFSVSPLYLSSLSLSNQYLFVFFLWSLLTFLSFLFQHTFYFTNFGAHIASRVVLMLSAVINFLSPTSSNHAAVNNTMDCSWDLVRMGNWRRRNCSGTSLWKVLIRSWHVLLLNEQDSKACAMVAVWKQGIGLNMYRCEWKWNLIALDSK